MHRVLTKRVFITFIIIACLSAAIYLWQLFGIQTPSYDHVFRVKQTDTIHTIAYKLYDQHLIKHWAYFYFTYFVFRRDAPIRAGGYTLSTDMPIREMLYTLQSEPTAKYVTLPEGLEKDAIGDIIADALGWGELDRQFFANTFAGMQWQRYEEMLEEIFTAEFKWDHTKVETFLTLSATYYDKQYDFFKKLYIPGTYEIPTSASRAQVAGMLIEQFARVYKDEHEGLIKNIDKPSMNNVAKLIETEMILMPDIVAIPTADITFKRSGNQAFLLFTTSYWNKGRGPLELIADPKTKGIAGDVERNVYQRIYQLDGKYTERLSGKFLWHSPHLHYHFIDFAYYLLEPVDIPEGSLESKLSQKSTFCVRDSEPIDLSHPGAQKEAGYKICGKERQGISPGWADSYYYTYKDQRFDITNLPKGVYRLKVIINPDDRFDEITKDNNITEKLVEIDVKNNKIKVLEDINKK